jgi:hypothetical protein
MKGIQFEQIGKKSVITQAATVGSARVIKGVSAQTTSMAVECGMSARAKLEINVNTLIGHLIRWTKEHQAPITESVLGLCEGTLTRKTASSLRAILAAYAPEVFLVASRLLSDIEDKHGPIPDVLVNATATRTSRGYVLNANFVEGVL